MAEESNYIKTTRPQRTLWQREIKMNRIRYILFCFFVFVSVGQSDYRIEWYTVDSGGGQSSGGSYVLTGMIGQPDAGYHEQTPYELLGGFWIGGPLCIVNLEHFAQFASYWLEGPCDAGNNWCDGADLNRVDDVNLEDLTILANEWLNICPFVWPLK